ncbi:MAG TPA: hypothetical protein VKT22_01900 [Steroidobacteraceae bacterium]|nr:hypothetical protein [Steroidobacteraceae bacterium]
MFTPPSNAAHRVACAALGARSPIGALNEQSAATRERTCNWIALGLLLAAWNAAHDDAGRVLRPEPLRPYPLVSVRALVRGALL